MQPAEARRYLAYLRMGLGAMWVAPRVGSRLFGLDPDQKGVTMLARLFAIRDLALGMALLQSSGADADRQVDLGIMVDGADLAAIVMAAGRKDVGAKTLLLGGVTAGAAVALGVMARGDD